MASESIAHSAFGLMGYWLRAHSGSRNNCLIAPRPIACLEVVGARKNGRTQYFQAPATQGYLGRSQKKKKDWGNIHGWIPRLAI